MEITQQTLDEFEERKNMMECRAHEAFVAYEKAKARYEEAETACFRLKQAVEEANAEQKDGERNA